MKCGYFRSLCSWFRGALVAISVLTVGAFGTFSVQAQSTMREQGGISSPELSRCAGKLGAQLRAGDKAFPLLSLMGAPWTTVEHTDQTINGTHIVAIVTGNGIRSRRRGEIVEFVYWCLIDDKGEAVSFTWRDVALERNEVVSSATIMRGTAYYQPRIQLPVGAELRVQLIDQSFDPPKLVTETVVRTAWEEPIPFVLRLPIDVKLEDHKLAIAVRLARGSSSLYGLKEPLVLDRGQLGRPIDLTIDPIAGGASGGGSERGSLRE